MESDIIDAIDARIIENLFYIEWLKDENYLNWGKFIDEKDLGINYIPYDADARIYSFFKVVDKNKWLITKIKYGI